MLILIISSKTHHSEYIFIPHQMNKVSLSKQADLELRSLQKVRFLLFLFLVSEMSGFVGSIEK